MKFLLPCNKTKSESQIKIFSTHRILLKGFKMVMLLMKFLKCCGILRASTSISGENSLSSVFNFFFFFFDAFLASTLKSSKKSSIESSQSNASFCISNRTEIILFFSCNVNKIEDKTESFCYFVMYGKSDFVLKKMAVDAKARKIFVTVQCRNNQI